MNKNQWRQEFLQRRQQFVREHGQKLLAEQLIQHCVQLLKTLKPKVILSYLARKDEVDPQGLSQRFAKSRWAYPRVVDQQLEFWQPNSLRALRPGYQQILEPIPEQSLRIELCDADVALIPGVSFDICGARLGYGKGFFDRALKSFRGVRIGLCWSVQFSVPFLPQETHDQSVDWIVTERFIYQPAKRVA